MSIADDLKSLQDLRDEEQLTEAEHAAAKTKLLGQEQPPPSKGASRVGRVIKTAAVTVVIGLLIVAAIGFGFVWYNVGSRATTQLVGATVHTPIQLMDEVQNVPANAWKAIPFTLSYSGTVAVNINVVHGNPMDVMVISPDQLANLKANKGQKVEYTDFDAQKIQVYERSASLQEGSYYLVLRDTSLGTLSAKASDIAVKIQLKP